MNRQADPVVCHSSQSLPNLCIKSNLRATDTTCSVIWYSTLQREAAELALLRHTQPAYAPFCLLTSAPCAASDDQVLLPQVSLMCRMLSGQPAANSASLYAADIAATHYCLPPFPCLCRLQLAVRVPLAAPRHHTLQPACPQAQIRSPLVLSPSPGQKAI